MPNNGISYGKDSFLLRYGPNRSTVTSVLTLLFGLLLESCLKCLAKSLCSLATYLLHFVDILCCHYQLIDDSNVAGMQFDFHSI